MSQNINVINSKENEIQFVMDVEGLPASEAKVCFVIETAIVDFSFKCRNTGDNGWEVMIPPLPNVDLTLYPFHIAVILDGYHFVPMNGTINMIKSPDIYVKDISNNTFPPAMATLPQSNHDVAIKAPMDHIHMESAESTADKILSESKAFKPTKRKKVKESGFESFISSNKKFGKEPTSADKKIKKILEDIEINTVSVKKRR